MVLTRAPSEVTSLVSVVAMVLTEAPSEVTSLVSVVAMVLMKGPSEAASLASGGLMNIMMVAAGVTGFWVITMLGRRYGFPV